MEGKGGARTKVLIINIDEREISLQQQPARVKRNRARIREVAGQFSKVWEWFRWCSGSRDIEARGCEWFRLYTLSSRPSPVSE